jgi:hypothetical protein
VITNVPAEGAVMFADRARSTNAAMTRNPPSRDDMISSGFISPASNLNVPSRIFRSRTCRRRIGEFLERVADLFSAKEKVETKAMACLSTAAGLVRAMVLHASATSFGRSAAIWRGKLRESRSRSCRMRLCACSIAGPSASR